MSTSADSKGARWNVEDWGTLACKLDGNLHIFVVEGVEDEFRKEGISFLLPVDIKRGHCIQAGVTLVSTIVRRTSKLSNR